jgi:hypothetical protein
MTTQSQQDQLGLQQPLEGEVQQAQQQVMGGAPNRHQQLQPQPQQPQQQQQHYPFLHYQLQPVNMGAHGALFPPLFQPPMRIFHGNTDNSDTRQGNPPGMISIAKHEQEIKILRAAHEDTVRRLNAEIESLKKTVRCAKESEQETKRKTQQELKEALKSKNKRQRSSNMNAPPSNKHDIKWIERYEELKAFVELHGHANVSKTEGQYRDLWQWCQTQRTGYSNLIRGQETNLSPDRIKLLNALNFQWVRSKTPALKWDERFEQLQHFRQKHGHVRIPQKLDEPKGLGNWVLEQRRRYREKDLPVSQRKSKKGPLTDEQIKRLESIDFEWSLRNRGSA